MIRLIGMFTSLINFFFCIGIRNVKTLKPVRRAMK